MDSRVNLSKTRLTTLHLDSAANPWQSTVFSSWAQSSAKQMVGNMMQSVEHYMKLLREKKFQMTSVLIHLSDRHILERIS